MKRYLEAGRLNSPRGLKGELRFDCWCDSIAFLSGVKYLYLSPDGEKPLEVKQFRETVSTVIFKGYEEREIAAKLTGRVVYFDREDIALPEGVFYNDDLIGVPVRDALTDTIVGKITKIEEGMASDLYYVEGEKKYIIPAAGDFIIKADPNGEVLVNLIDGLEA